MSVVAPAWIPYWRQVENWIPWMDLWGNVRVVLNWRTATNPSQYTFSGPGEFWTDINGLYDPTTGNLIASGEFNRNVSHCVTPNGLVCGCGRTNLLGCFPPGVVILMGDGSHKKVEDIVAGDFIWNPVRQRAVKVQEIVDGPEQLPILQIKTSSRTLKVTQEHPILVHNNVIPSILQKGFSRTSLLDGSTAPLRLWKTKQAKEVLPGDLLYTTEGLMESVTDVTALSVEEGQYVINFILSTDSEDPADHMLVSDGLVTGDLFLQQSLSRKRRGNE